jgi:hypothetical protein
MKDFLLEIVQPGLTEESRIWLKNTLRRLTTAVRDDELLTAYTAASRRLGKETLQLDEGERTHLAELEPGLSLDHWGADEIGRAILLLSISHLPGTEYVALVTRCYENGDSREQQSWLRSLYLLPHREEFCLQAIDACRTNILQIFEAIACENPYPARFFPDGNFNQLVLKSLFSGIRISRIVELESRLNPDLSRMADDYASEREAAGREVPSDIWLVLAPRIGENRLPRVQRYLRHENPEHRYWAAMGLGLRGDLAIRDELLTVRKNETTPRVLRAIDTSLERLVQ